MTRSREQHATDARTPDLDYPPGVDNNEPEPLSAPAHIRQQQESRACGHDALEARSRGPERLDVDDTVERAARDRRSNP